MRRATYGRIALTAALGVALAVAAVSAASLGGGLKRNIIERANLSIAGREAVVAQVEIEPGVLAGRHTHPGEEIAYVLAGEGELLIDGQEPRKLKAGDAFVVPAGTVHDARNTGTTTIRVLGVYVVEKGKPLASPAD
jgi:quercetin dioxygenase-like cupin family protein